MTDIFLTVLNMSITASYCILFVCFVRLLMKKLPKIYSYLLWLVVAFRLICPFAVESGFSLVRERFVNQEMNVTVTSAIANHMTKPGSVDDTNYLSDYGNSIGEADEANKMSDNDTGMLANIGEISYSDKTESVNILGTNTEITDEITKIDIPFLAARIWLAGLILLIGYSIFTYVRLKVKLQKAHKEKSTFHTVTVWEIKGLDTPFVLGILRPAIYLPSALQPWVREQCLAHEYTHIRRKDYLIKQLAFLLTCVYWFHPLVWLAFYLMTKDMEMSCDEFALRSTSLEDRKAYSETLLELSSETRCFAGCPLAFGENSISARIKNIMNYKRPGFWGMLLASILVIVCIVGLCTNPNGKKTDSQDSQSQNEAELQQNAVTDDSASNHYHLFAGIDQSDGQLPVKIYTEPNASSEVLMDIEPENLVEVKEYDGGKYALVTYHNITGYVEADLLCIDVTDNTQETYAYWIGKLWADAFCSQDCSLLFEMCEDKESFQNWDMIYEDKSNRTLNFRDSSTWPSSLYQICVPGTDLLRKQNSDVRILYYVPGGEGEVTVWTQRLNVSKNSITTLADMADSSVVFSEFKKHDQVDSFAEFVEAYVNSNSISLFDFEGSGISDIIEQSGNQRYAEPVTALETYLHLDGGTGTILTKALVMTETESGKTANEDSNVYVRYTFDTDGYSINVPMYQPTQKNIWCIDKDRLSEFDISTVLTYIDVTEEARDIWNQYINESENNVFLTQSWEDKKIDLDMLFYDNPLPNAPISDAEKAELNMVNGQNQEIFYHLTGEQIDSFLHEKTGYQLNEIKYKEKLENTLKTSWTYLEDYDSYTLFAPKGDTLRQELTCTRILLGYDGSIWIFYEATNPLKGSWIEEGNVIMNAKGKYSRITNPEDYLFSANTITTGEGTKTDYRTQ